MDWKTAPLSELIAHILCTHHKFLRRELPRLEASLNSVYRGGRDKTLAALPETLFLIKIDLDLHLRKKESSVFPAIEAAEGAARSGSPFECIANPIRGLQAEHDSLEEALARLRAVTQNYRVPPDAPDVYGELVRGLAELDRNLTIHVDLENDILFPRALALHREFGTIIPNKRSF